MQRVNKIIENSEYISNISEIETLEKDRIFCHHDMNHFLDVARIATILCFEEGIYIDKESLYAAAILHDIGRGRQYTEGIEHEAAGVLIAEPILRECGFSDNETAAILEAIREHGNEDVKIRKDIVGVLYRADKLSRKCFCCNAVSKCHKPDSKKNMGVVY